MNDDLSLLINIGAGVVVGSLAMDVLGVENPNARAVVTGLGILIALENDQQRKLNQQHSDFRS